MKILYAILAVVFLSVFAFSPSAEAVYLNVDNMDVEIGVNSTYSTSNDTFSYGGTIDKVIDAPTAASEEFHDQFTHIWFTGGVLELIFDLRVAYDLTTLHFWNYTSEGFDVDEIGLTFFDGDNVVLGMLTVFPGLGSFPGIAAEDIAIAAPQDVRFVAAVLSGTNGHVDFQNMGFTGSLSTDRCATNPNDPICETLPPDTIPAPGGLGLLIAGMVGTGLMWSRGRRPAA